MNLTTLPLIHCFVWTLVFFYKGRKLERIRLQKSLFSYFKYEFFLIASKKLHFDEKVLHLSLNVYIFRLA